MSDRRPQEARRPWSWLIFDVGQKMKPLLPLIVALFLAACVRVPSPGANVAKVNFSDGIDRAEAAELAAAYLATHMTASFGHTQPIDAASEWHIKITGDVVPFELADIPPVRIDKRSGAIVWDAKPPLKRE